MTQLLVNDIFSANVDLLVIPQSTGGTMSRVFSEYIYALGLQGEIRQGELGDVNLVPVTGSNSVRYIAFAFSVNDNTSSYAGIYRIIKNLARLIPKDVKSLALPMLGAGAGHLNGVKVYQVLKTALEEMLPSHTSTVYTLDTELLSSIDSSTPLNPNAAAVKLAFDFTVDSMRNIYWVTEMIEMKDFYFELARRKFHQFLTWGIPGFDFKSLLKDFIDSKTVFSKYLPRFENQPDVYQFLTICGELISYIDKHAFNKKIWNQYPDKRTMAMSAVNQTRWIENLIRFRAVNNSDNAVTASVRNAFKYLNQPAKNLTMLSANHRTKLAQSLFNDIQENELLSAVDKYFIDHGFKCTNTDNNGSLFSQILYAPEIKALWIEEPIRPEDTEAKPPTPVATALPEDQKEVQDIPDEVRLRNLNALMHSDLYASIDLLNYDSYASIIARLITSNFSKPPFNISILAPWGKGKTSLMRFIQKKINPAIPEPEPLKERPVSTIKTLLNWVNAPNELFSEFKKLEYPVIWFNAWKFQKSEQVWAGLADEIIRQLAAQLTTVDRERFWLKLNIKRVDRDKLKRELIFKLIQKYLLPMVYGLLSFACGAWLFTHLKDKINFLMALPILGGAGLAIAKVLKTYKQPAELDVGKFVLQPEYRQKMGYLQAVEDDLRQAIDIVININKPAVIFIDDLDRCSPTVISEVVEAINAFMSGDLSNCYFIIGQDPQMVTASLDATYENIAGKIGKLESHHTSIGRFFLEKFSQLSMNIPIMGDKQKLLFVETLIAGLDSEAIPDATKQTLLLEEYRKLEVELDSLADPELIYTDRKKTLESQIRLFKPELVTTFQEKILGYAFKNYRLDDNELENLISDVAEYLDSPRTIKRFLNLFLFYHFYRFTIPGRALADVDEQLLGRWLVVMVRWPMLVQAIQWDTEKGFLSGANAIERAHHFDQLMDSCTDFKTYAEKLSEENTTEASWLADNELFSICKDLRGAVKIATIVEAGIW